MNAPQQIAPDILCLAHTAKKIEWCDRAETCERHVTIRRDGIGNCGQCQWSAGRARSETRRIDKETEMHLSRLERYEIQAEAFRRMTGHLAPGKDAAAVSYD